MSVFPLYSEDLYGFKGAKKSQGMCLFVHFACNVIYMLCIFNILGKYRVIAGVIVGVLLIGAGVAFGVGLATRETATITTTTEAVSSN